MFLENVKWKTLRLMSGKRGNMLSVELENVCYTMKWKMPNKILSLFLFYFLQEEYNTNTKQIK